MSQSIYAAEERQNAQRRQNEAIKALAQAQHDSARLKYGDHALSAREFEHRLQSSQSS